MFRLPCPEFRMNTTALTDQNWKSKKIHVIIFFKKIRYDETLDIFYLRFIFVYQKYLNERRTFETDFWVQNHLLEFFLVLTVHRGYFVFKISKTYVKCCNNCNEKPVLKLRSKDFWYTNYSSMETALVKICPKGLVNTIIKAL